MRFLSNVVIFVSFLLFFNASFAGTAEIKPRKLSECLEAIEEGRVLYGETNANYDKYRAINDGSLFVYLYRPNSEEISCNEIVMD